MLPNFICPGAAKSGTTTLFELLNQHPDIFLPEVKETFFFWNSDYYNGSEWYEKQYFDNVKNEKIIGDITPLDMYFDYIPKRIHDTLGANIKILFILRNPAERAFSHYLMSVRQRFESKSFEEAISLEENRLTNGELDDKRHFSYTDRGFYGKQIQNFLNYFSIENMHFVLFEEFVKRPEIITKEIFRFLHVEENININYRIHSNKGYTIKYIKLHNLLINVYNRYDLINRIFPKKLKNKIIQLLTTRKDQNQNIVIKQKT